MLSIEYGRADRSTSRVHDRKRAVAQRIANRSPWRLGHLVGGREEHLLSDAGRDKPEFNDLWQLDDRKPQEAMCDQECQERGAAAKPSPSPDGKGIAFYRGPVLMLAAANGAKTSESSANVALRRTAS